MSDKKDLTQITELPPLEPSESEDSLEAFEPLDTESAEGLGEGFDSEMLWDEPASSPEVEEALAPEEEEVAAASHDDDFAMDAPITDEASNFDSAPLEEQHEGEAFNTFEEPSTPPSVPTSEFEVAPAEDFAMTPESEPAAAAAPAPTPSAPTPPPPAEKPEPISAIRAYSESARESAPPPAVPASHPFNLHLIGELDPYDREKLLEILEKENYGFSAEEIQPQLEAHHVFLPRISEYAAVYLIHKMRDASVEFQLELPDQEPEFESRSTETRHSEVRVQIPTLAADQIPVLSGSEWPTTLGRVQPIDTYVLSETLNSSAVEPTATEDFQVLLDNLKRELKQRAYRKGASAVIHFQVHVVPLHARDQYRVTVLGTAVKPLEDQGHPPETSPEL